MRHALTVIGDMIWAMFLDDNEWWINNLAREEAYFSQPGVVRR